MNFEQTIHEMLTSRGLFPEQAERVVALAKEDSTLEAMSDRWQDDTSGYPKAVLSAMWISVKGIACDWIRKNCPKAWFLPMFDGTM